MKYLICNPGSSSLKFSLFGAGNEQLLAEGGIDWSDKPTRLILKRAGQPDVRKELALRKHADAMAGVINELQTGSGALLKRAGEVRAVGHRIVHGGDRYTAAVQITPEVERGIKDLTELAPLHNPTHLGLIPSGKPIRP